ncbi:MAG: hypothetical protein Q8S13_14750, partial [Dehalococcoidia bacterium]|nr:hypothetical protein [Dehalococcoidia bacterium]
VSSFLEAIHRGVRFGNEGTRAAVAAWERLVPDLLLTCRVCGVQVRVPKDAIKVYVDWAVPVGDNVVPIRSGRT